MECMGFSPQESAHKPQSCFKPGKIMQLGSPGPLLFPKLKPVAPCNQTAPPGMIR